MQDEEVGISLKDVLIYCFLHWRSAIAVVLIGVALGGGYYGLKSYASMRPAPVEVAGSGDELAELEAAEVGLSATEANEMALGTQRDLLAYLAEYLDNSLLMQIDPNDEHVARADLAISSYNQLSSQAADSFVAAYGNRLTSAAALENLAEELDTTPSYLRELITVDSTSNTSGVAAGEGTGITIVQPSDEGRDNLVATISIVVIAPSEEVAALVRDTLADDVSSYTDEISAAVSAHSVAEIGRYDYTAVDYDLLVKQGDRAQRYSTFLNNLNNNAKYQVSEDADTSAVASDGISLRALAKSALKGAVLGGVAAFLLYGFVLCLRYVLDASPVMRGQIEARYALPEVGSYAYGSEAFYRGATGFDRWLRKLSGLDDPSDPAAVAEMVAANVRLYAEDAKTVLVSSSVGVDKAAALAEALSEKLGDRSFVLANQLVSSADARGQLKAADAVIFVEEYGRSTYEDIDAEITLAAETGKTPLGLVMA